MHVPASHPDLGNAGTPALTSHWVGRQDGWAKQPWGPHTGTKTDSTLSRAPRLVPRGDSLVTEVGDTQALSTAQRHRPSPGQEVPGAGRQGWPGARAAGEGSCPFRGGWLGAGVGLFRGEPRECRGWPAAGGPFCVCMAEGLRVRGMF